VGPATLARYDWKPGDRVTLRSNVWNVDLDLRIVGEIPQRNSPIVWVQREYLDQAIQAQGRPAIGITGLVWVRAETPEAVQPVMERIDELTRRSDSPTTTQTEKSFFASFLGSLRGFLSVVLAVTALVALCIVFIAANTASMGVRERAGEIAVLKAIGFGRRVIFGTLLAEAVILSAGAGLAGVLVAVGLTKVLGAFATWSEALGPLGSFIITAPVIVQGVFLSLFVGMLAGVVPSYGAARKPVVETLHEVF
jgi:putative ABC transport system permease protein